MKLPPVLIDLTVWAGLAGVFVTILMLVGYINRPPTPAEQRATAEASVRQDCLAWDATQALPNSMRDNVCTCMVSRANVAFGGLDQGDFNVCRQRVATRMTEAPDLDRLFEANFPALCGVLEGRLAGLATDGTSDFCGCYGVQVQDIPVVKAAYAFGGGEAVSEERNERIRYCGSMLSYGEGWKPAGTASASMRMPPFAPFQEVVLRCDAGGIVLEVRQGAGLAQGGISLFDEDGTPIGARSEGGILSGPSTYGVVEKLMVRDRIELQVADAHYDLQMAGFAAQAELVLAACPEPKIKAPTAAAIDHAYPDTWETIDAGYAYLRGAEGSNWFGTLVCDTGPTYLTLQGELVEQVIARFPDPSGERLADNVPLSVDGAEGPLFTTKTFCDWGANEGDTDSCFVILDRERTDKLFSSGFLAMTLGGEALDTVAFATAPAVSDARDACYRNVGPLS